MQRTCGHFVWKKTHLTAEQALGISWDTEEDQLTIDVTAAESIPNTRWGILTLTCGLYDPAGFVSPAVPKDRILLQELCGLCEEF